MIVFGTRIDLEQRLTAQRLVELFDDDGDGAVAGSDLASLQTIMDEANDIVAGLLLNKGFNAVQLELLKADKQIQRAWSGIAAQLAGERKPEWLNERGQGPYDAFGLRGRAELKALATGETRSLIETVTGGSGANLGISGGVQTRAFLFSPDPNDPNDRGPGGF
jgi:hypothetical protein